ncbi:hypothetical protein [Halobacterium sp. CBA1126]|uniref:hypothetical protein n=1 Tax=Halobacterium sp. CBA1126 TaxID=2668074 RepID=UPI0012FAE2A2|nr:hypothetical protein [Halobacterium sp. CBA1126]MUV61087.1 hypothetical protein [Halobacterium sp. CBA1126]
MSRCPVPRVAVVAAVVTLVAASPATALAAGTTDATAVESGVLSVDVTGPGARPSAAASTTCGPTRPPPWR